ncbi:MAG: hypothetical protein ABR921_16665 [Candidatus Sulfotelmatobacter sp.]|jgi:hypothetical protein
MCIGKHYHGSHLTVSDDRTATVSLILPALNSQPAALARHLGQNIA